MDHPILARSLEDLQADMDHLTAKKEEFANMLVEVTKRFPPANLGGFGLALRGDEITLVIIGYTLTAFPRFVVTGMGRLALEYTFIEETSETPVCKAILDLDGWLNLVDVKGKKFDMDSARTEKVRQFFTVVRDHFLVSAICASDAE